MLTPKDRQFWDIVVSAPLTADQLEILKLKEQLAEVSKKACEYEVQLGEYKELFRLGWRPGELQFRLTAEQVLYIMPWFKIK